MAKYRTVEPVTYVADGVVVSVAKAREIELTEDQAKGLAGSVLLIESGADSMFPTGAPIIEPTIVRTVPATPVAGEAVEPHPEPKSVAKTAEKPNK